MNESEIKNESGTKNQFVVRTFAENRTWTVTGISRTHGVKSAQVSSADMWVRFASREAAQTFCNECVRIAGNSRYFVEQI